MSLAMIVTLVVFVLIFLLRMPISLGMIAAGTFYFIFTGTDLGSVANHIMNTYYSNYVIIAVPLFIFTANVMNSGKVTEMIFKFATGLAGGRRGALGHVNVIASLIFSGMTGSAIADASGLGKMEIDAMKKAGYDDSFSCAITAASATVGPIFPPSIPLVMYAMLSGASVGALFLGGMVPALLICLGLMIYVSVVSKVRNYPREEKVPMRAFLTFTLQAMPALLTPIILLMGIYTGVVTPTEAGAIAAIYAILVAILAYKAMNLKGLLDIIKDTIKDTGSVSLMVGAAAVISYIVAREQVASELGTLVLSLTDNKYVFLIVVNVIILILGMFIDTSTIQLVFVPIMIPVAKAFGIDLVHFGLVVTLNMMIGLSTPPFGMLLFITAGISGTSLKAVMKEIMWPIIAMLAILLLITFVPEIVLFLPKTFGLM
ncbi:TRAP transporter large permease [Fusibacter bizertensis]|jgi:TRAP transporter, DctM subunit|uniref:TRAP transporter large permease n=1 Tax=Fusibacter bizertensis TaxID=1488331 RepID=A0ABT6NAA6_9FIRM|nr:TRAP transporter large permease [Fusibacter bizertensis]MDH8677344.1 TRAP transporter large permease [Fusibacter bizertensis]